MSKPNHLYLTGENGFTPSDPNDLDMTVSLFLWFIQGSHKELMPSIEKYNSFTLKFKFLLK